MATVRVLVLRAPGTNCDVETAHAFQLAGARCQREHIYRLREQPRLLEQFQVLCIPGGFSFGDDVGAGRILATQLQHHLGEQLRGFAERDRLVLGICNGFQVLIQTGLLGCGTGPQREATLTWNDSGRFEDRWVRLRCEESPCVFLQGVQQLFLPVAHAEGKFVARDEQTLKRLAAAGQLPLRYAPLVPEEGGGAAAGVLPYPDNPNGSQANVAGMCDPSGRVLGLMPHPERYVDPTQHPQWTRQRAAEGTLPPRGQGLVLFQNAVRYFQ